MGGAFTGIFILHRRASPRKLITHQPYTAHVLRRGPPVKPGRCLTLPPNAVTGPAYFKQLDRLPGRRPRHLQEHAQPPALPLAAGLQIGTLFLGDQARWPS